MPLTFQTPKDKNYFTAIWTGRVSESEMVEGYRSFLSTHDDMGHFKEFCDMSDAELSEITLKGLKQLSALIREYCERNHVEDARCACYIPKPINRSTMALYDATSQESAETTRVFSTEEEALAWLEA